MNDVQLRSYLRGKAAAACLPIFLQKNLKEIRHDLAVELAAQWSVEAADALLEELARSKRREIS